MVRTYHTSVDIWAAWSCSSAARVLSTAAACPMANDLSGDVWVNTAIDPMICSRMVHGPCRPDSTQHSGTASLVRSANQRTKIKSTHSHTHKKRKTSLHIQNTKYTYYICYSVLLKYEVFVKVLIAYHTVGPPPYSQVVNLLRVQRPTMQLLLSYTSKYYVAVLVHITSYQHLVARYQGLLCACSCSRTCVRVETKSALLDKNRIRQLRRSWERPQRTVGNERNMVERTSIWQNKCVRPYLPVKKKRGGGYHTCTCSAAHHDFTPCWNYGTVCSL